jgi:cobyrinic acid a,c-diamide synthase
MKALVIAGTRSGVGKTSLSLGIMAALRRRGLRVQSFKVGPDFIDPGHHRLATGRISHNLDGWMLSKHDNLALFRHYSRDCDVAIIEGVMGVFDGYGATSEDGSTAQIAKWLGVPVLLVVDASRMSRSVAALVSGYIHFDADLSITGIALNKVGNTRNIYRTTHPLSRLGEAIASVTSIPIWGEIPKNSVPEIPSRHLGLWMAQEDNLGNSYIERLAQATETYVDLDNLLASLPDWRGELAVEGDVSGSLPQNPSEKPSGKSSVRIAIARDAAFCFYYEENLRLLREAGATLIEVSPLQDEFPQGIDGFYFGGGYPELHGERLSQNQGFLEGLRRFAAENRPIYGECGGLIYLSQGIEVKDVRYRFAGIFPFWTRLGDRPNLGYTKIETSAKYPFCPQPLTVNGHRFHYSQLIPETVPPEIPTCYQAHSWRIGAFSEGYVLGNSLASYVHLHFRSNPAFAKQFVEACRGLY